MDDRHFQDGEVAEGQLLVPRGDAPTLLEPRDATLDGVPKPVGARIEDATPAAAALLVGPLRDHRLDLSAMKPVPDVAVTVTLCPQPADGDGHADAPWKKGSESTP